jgi:hypothetical protein
VVEDKEDCSHSCADAIGKALKEAVEVLAEKKEAREEREAKKEEKDDKEKK